MTTYYKVLRPITSADLGAPARIVKVLKLIPQDGYVTFERFRHLGSSRAAKGLAHACSIGILKRVPPHERIMKLNSVKFWLTQLNDSGHRNTPFRSGTKQSYVDRIAKFDEWLCGRSFPTQKDVMLDGLPSRQDITKSFGNIEELLKYCDESNYGPKTVHRVMREYMVSPRVAGTSASTQAANRSAIKSYFAVHDIALDLYKARRNRTNQATSDDSFMTLGNFYKMLYNGNPFITLRTVMLAMLQSGMDASTITDRFSFEGYGQLVKYFKTEDHTAWNLNMCPVPIKLVRVKTDYQYTTFLDHDAIVQLQEYLTWKEAKHGKQDASKPLFLTKQNNPIYSAWVSKGFSDVAVRTGIQERVSHRAYKIHAHQVRHLLKSTLIASGCKQYAADHILGHAPRDSYEKQAILYPEELRAEYAKASSSLNIISKVENNLNSQRDPESQDTRIRDLEAQLRELTQAKATGGLASGERNDVMSEMNEKMNQLLRWFGALPDDIKKRMSDKPDD